MVAQHLVQLLLRPGQGLLHLFPVQSRQTGMSPGVVADFAAQIEGALPKILIRRFQGLAHHEKRNGNVVFFAQIQNFGHMFPAVAVVHGQGDLRNVTVAVENGKSLRNGRPGAAERGGKEHRQKKKNGKKTPGYAAHGIASCIGESRVFSVVVLILSNEGKGEKLPAYVGFLGKKPT